MANTNTITYIAFHTTNDASDFGNTSIETKQGAACASTVRAVQAHGSTSSGNEDELEYVTVASTSDASDFGDQLNSPINFSGCSDGTRGEWWSGTTDGSNARNNIFYITIASTGNATDGADVSDEGWLDNSATSGT